MPKAQKNEEPKKFKNTCQFNSTFRNHSSTQKGAKNLCQKLILKPFAKFLSRPKKFQMGAFLRVAFRIRNAAYRFLAARAIHIRAFSIVLCSLCQRERANSQKQ
jgi:hypothetical protein